jgi:hypothetical protein
MRQRGAEAAPLSASCESERAAQGGVYSKRGTGMANLVNEVTVRYLAPKSAQRHATQAPP